jgi:hypothetical protein
VSKNCNCLKRLEGIEKVQFFLHHFQPKDIYKVVFYRIDAPSEKPRFLYWSGICSKCNGYQTVGVEFGQRTSTGVTTILEAIECLEKGTTFVPSVTKLEAFSLLSKHMKTKKQKKLFEQAIKQELGIEVCL